MAPAPLVVSLLLGMSAATGVVDLALDPNRFSGQSAVLIAIGLGLLTLATVSGVLLARGRWSRWMTLVVAGLWFAQAVTRPLDVLTVTTIATAVAAASVAAGPWLRRWLRHLPAADAPPPAAVILLLLLTSTPALIGFATAAGASVSTGWALTAWSLLLAFGLARAISPALWAGRIAHLPISLAGGLLLGFRGAAAVLIKATVETVLLWRRDLHHAVSPLVPERVTPVAVPPELVDPTIMKAAGLDERGRPLEGS